MKSYDLEDNIVSCILQKNELINELYISIDCFNNSLNRLMLNYFKDFYKQHKTLDLTLMVSSISNKDSQKKLMDYASKLLFLSPSPALFYEYQEQLEENHKTFLLGQLIDDYKLNKIDKNKLVNSILDIQNKNFISSNNSKKITPEDMINKIRNKDNYINFDRLWRLGTKIKLKKHTVNIIAARPSEGKSALALNIFIDLSKKYKTLFFNLEMTDVELYERMLGIESDIPISKLISPEEDRQDKLAYQSARNIYNLNYEVVHGSQSFQSIKSKIIKEARNEHVIVFIDYVGYVKNKSGQSDKDRIGEITRECNDLTKDYNCTIFLVAQINREGSDKPSMRDLKDSGELEQTADIIILIYDEHPENKSSVKDVKLLIPKCRGGRRNIAINSVYDKTKQKFDFRE